MTARKQNLKNAALQERNGSYDLTVLSITAKSVPHSRRCAVTTNRCGTGTPPGIPAVYILRHHIGVKMMLKD
jgi:hypothetical protein